MSLQPNVTELFALASILSEKKEHEAALRQYYQAWVKLPTPQNQQPQAASILAAIGNTYFQLQRYEPAIEALRSALDIPTERNNALTLLRLGQCLLDNGQALPARTYLQRAYRIGGLSLFNNEDDRYIHAIRDLVA